MRYILLIAIGGILIASCKKDKFTSEPQLSFVSVKPDFYRGGLIADEDYPVITLHVTDAEGDLGFINGQDTSMIYIKNLRTNKFDSAYLPNIKPIAGKNFEADIEIFMKQFIGVPVNVRDTIYFDIYIKDFAKNKSNVLRTGKPIYYIP
ncbi:MAG: hypothetical protein U0V75_12095 [Ferruginibacter sp.]